MKWYSKDAFSDVQLKLCKAESRGVWYDMLWLMDAAVRRGYLSPDGIHPFSDDDLCRVLAVTPEELSRSKADLKLHEVPSVEDGTGIWYNRRMVADEQKRNLCGDAGFGGGGNPALTPPPQSPPQGENTLDAHILICSEGPIKVDCASPIKVIEADFNDVWKLYPDKTGKAKAQQAYEKAVKLGDTKETILAGLQRYLAYVEAKRRAFPDLKWKNGSTWFNQQGWLDEYTVDREASPQGRRHHAKGRE